MNHNPQKIPRVSPYEIWYYSCPVLVNPESREPPVDVA